jgi:hypothetical protein
MFGDVAYRNGGTVGDAPAIGKHSVGETAPKI